MSEELLYLPIWPDGDTPPLTKVDMGVWSRPSRNSIAASIYDKYWAGPSIRPICTRCCFTMTRMIQACSNFH